MSQTKQPLVEYPWLTETTIAETHYMADGRVVEIDIPTLAEQLRKGSDEARQQSQEIIGFRTGYQPTEAEEQWLAQVNKILSDKLWADLENLMIFGTTDVPT